MSTLTFTIIQANLFWEDKKSNLDMFGQKIMSIAERTEVVVLPEMFSTGFSMRAEDLAENMDGETALWMKRIAAEKRIILSGSLIVEEEGNYLNRLIWMLPNGTFGFYDKKHLFAYAGEDGHYTSGGKRLIASVKGWKVNLLICYDLRFPVWSRQVVNNDAPEYDVLVYVANWPNKRSHAWKTLLQARAIENQCFCIGVNRVGNDGNGIYYSGDSMVVSPLGEVMYTTADSEDAFTITLHKRDLDEVREKMPFWRDADPFILLQQ